MKDGVAATVGLTRRPAFWIAYAGLALISLAIAWKLFALAIPLVNLDITLSRQDAIAKAEALSARHQLAPDGARAAARFSHDQSTQNYVELEGGGKPAFAQLVAGTIYAPYWWEVRLFAAGEVTESIVRFRPDGTAYGFAKRVPELSVPADPAGLVLDALSARRLAEGRARDAWAVDFSPFRLLEQTQQTRRTGRVDHLFIYERTAQTIGEARFRLRIGVSGDELTEVTWYVHIPESFDRRFEELRSANNTIAGIASLSAGVLYGLGGCLLGVLWLLRAHWLQWRPALAAGFIVGALMGATTLANTPAAWFGFDTAQSVTTFWLRQAGVALVVTLGGGLGYALVFMAAESLSRRAFPQHPQLWRAWSRDAAPTKQILGRTLGGYLFVSVQLAMIAVFYYATNRWLGWWQPSESLTDPNILGSFVPALAPIAMSLQAGFMEESLFRAVPLALAAIVGARFGKRGLAIGIAVVIQALIFGGAHANYPGFPSYSRPVELIVPSVLWALIFLRFGLLPTVLLHALFDLALFAIPVFLVDAPGSTLQRALIIAAALVPLAVVLARRWRAGAW
ncbi:MAG: CPBP family intramembrane metalloprotease, partial [Aromatoleum sp.]|nr:CPBP family intramembrane metalloprotease [Aromatoleum sp.]